MHHDHEHCHNHDHGHDCHCGGHHHEHGEHCSCGHHHHHDQDCHCGCHQPAPMDELVALMKYMVGHNAAHARELADLARKLEEIGNHTAFEQVMAAVSDFEKGNLRLSAILASLK